MTDIGTGSGSANMPLGSFASKNEEINPTVERSPSNCRNVIFTLNLESMAWLACDKNNESKPKSMKLLSSSSTAIPDKFKKIALNSWPIRSFGLAEKRLPFETLTTVCPLLASMSVAVEPSVQSHTSALLIQTVPTSSETILRLSGTCFAGSIQKRFRSNGYVGKGTRIRLSSA